MLVCMATILSSTSDMAAIDTDQTAELDRSSVERLVEEYMCHLAEHMFEERNKLVYGNEKRHRVQAIANNHSAATTFFQNLIQNINEFHSECASSALLRAALLMKRVVDCSSPVFGTSCSFKICEVSGRLCNRQIFIPYENETQDQSTAPLISAVSGASNMTSSFNIDSLGRKQRKTKSNKISETSCSMYIDESYNSFCISLWMLSHIDSIFINLMDHYVKSETNTGDIDLVKHVVSKAKQNTTFSSIVYDAICCVNAVIEETRKHLYNSKPVCDTVGSLK